jgi:hypothetical protein
MNEDPRDRTSEADHEPRQPLGEDGPPADAGAYIGHEPEFTREGEAGVDARATAASDQPATGVDEDPHAGSPPVVAPD